MAAVSLVEIQCARSDVSSTHTASMYRTVGVANMQQHCINAGLATTDIGVTTTLAGMSRRHRPKPKAPCSRMLLCQRSHLSGRQAAPVERVPAAGQAAGQVPAGAAVAVQDAEVVTSRAATAVPAIR